MSRSIQIFVECTLCERVLIDYLNSIIGGGVESLSFPVDEALYFAQVLDYEDGYCLGLNISWKDDVLLNLDEMEIATAVASKFGTSVLFELGDNQNQWCMIDRSGARSIVNVVEVNDGIMIKV